MSGERDKPYSWITVKPDCILLSLKLPEGDVVLRHPNDLSQESLGHVRDWLEQIKPRLIEPTIGPPEDET